MHKHTQFKFKVSVIGAGNVGATAAYAMMLDGTPTEMALIDIDTKRLEGLSLDFQHALSLLPYTKLEATDDYAACKDSDLIFITAGARQKEGETRLDLVDKNKKIFANIVPQILKNAPNAIIVVVSNPVDVLTYETIKLAGLPEGRVFGSGTWLDTSRFRFHLAQKVRVHPSSIEAFILGEHGDTSFPVLSSANIAGKPLLSFHQCPIDYAEKCYQDARNAAYRIINDIGFTSYSIAVVIREIMLAVFEDSRIVAPVSVPLKNYHGISDVALSVPAAIGNKGIEEIIEVPLNQYEMDQLKHSAETLKQYL